MVGEDEDIVKLSGINPFVGELEVHVTSEYASSDSLDRMIAPMMLMPQVSEVKVHTELVDKVNATLRSVGLGLLIVAVALLIVSFVLIFKTFGLCTAFYNLYNETCRCDRQFYTPSVPCR